MLKPFIFKVSVLGYFPLHLGKGKDYLNINIYIINNGLDIQM